MSKLASVILLLALLFFQECPQHKEEKTSSESFDTDIGRVTKIRERDIIFYWMVPSEVFEHLFAPRS